MGFDEVERLRRQLEDLHRMAEGPLRHVLAQQGQIEAAARQWRDLQTSISVAAIEAQQKIDRMSVPLSVGLAEEMKRGLLQITRLDFGFANETKTLYEHARFSAGLSDAARLQLEEVTTTLANARTATIGIGLDAKDWAVGVKDMLSSVALSSAAFKALVATDSIASMARYATQLPEVTDPLLFSTHRLRDIASEVGSMSKYLHAAELTLGTIEEARIGELISSERELQGMLGRSTLALGQRHAELITSLSLSDGMLASVPLFVSQLPTLDLFVHSGAVRSITPHRSYKRSQDAGAVSLRAVVVDETAVFLEAALPDLKQAFLGQYRGAKARVSERGPDWWTQGASSMRKLFKGVLHTAAPDELVGPWATMNNKRLDSNGKPTRATKVDWLCEFILNDPYRAFVKTELTSALVCIEMIDSSQHVDDYPEFEDQYNWILLRVEMAIRHILTIWKSRSGN